MDEQSVVGTTQQAILPRGAEESASPFGGDEIPMFGEDGFTFLDFLDIINPLQHIPIVSSIYRDLTGDTLDYGSRVAGGALFGGPIGALFSVVNGIFEETTGKDVGGHVVAFFSDDSTMTAETIPEAYFETVEGGTLSEPDLFIQRASSRANFVKEISLAPLSPRPLIDAAQPTAPPAHTEDRHSPSNRSFLENDAISELAAQAGGPSTHPPIRTPPRPAPAKNQNAAPSETMAALLRESEKEAGVFAAIQQRVASATPEASKAAIAAAKEPPRPVAGAIAPEGGWFSEVMLTALAKYKDSAELARATRPADSLTN